MMAALTAAALDTYPIDIAHQAQQCIRRHPLHFAGLDRPGLVAPVLVELQLVQANTHIFRHLKDVVALQKLRSGNGQQRAVLQLTGCLVLSIELYHTRM